MNPVVRPRCVPGLNRARPEGSHSAPASNASALLRVVSCAPGIVQSPTSSFHRQIARCHDFAIDREKPQRPPHGAAGSVQPHCFAESGTSGAERPDRLRWYERCKGER